MKTFYKLSLIILSIFTSFEVTAQTTPKANITGIILDENKKPADYVTVVLFKAADSSIVKTAFTDQAGTFGFTVNTKGNYFYKASSMGYKTLKSKVVTLDDSQKIDFGSAQLSPTSQSLKEVTVAGNVPLVERKMDRTVMNVASSSIASGSTALELLQKAPGVNVDQNDNISMQGKQGVLIQIDGKQTYMSSGDVANLLRGMQSSEIETIELITNPSAKYDAAGNSGIINIKTKKNKSGGTNGSLTGAFGRGTKFRSSAGGNINHRTKSLNLFGNYNYYQRDRETFMEIDRIATVSPSNRYFSQRSDFSKRNHGQNFKAGVDYFINKNNTIGVLVTGYEGSNKEFSVNRTRIGGSFAQQDSSVLANNVIRNKYNNLSYNLNYKSVLDSAGQELTIDLDYGRYKGNDDADYVSDYFFNNGSIIRPTVITRNITPSVINIKAFKIDYALPLKKQMKLEAGLKSSWVTTDNNLIAEQFLNNNWQNNQLLSNQFVYDENVNAAYVNFNKQFKKTSIQLGLRAEQTTSKGNSITTNKVIEREYLNFFPSVFVNQTLDKNNDISLSYSRRIDRPSYDALNPFVYFLDQYTYSQGNPFLNPQYTNNFEFTYLLKKKYSVTLNYSRTIDVITEVILPDNEKQALYQTNQNIATQNAYSMVINVPVSLTKWWSSNNNLNLFHIGFKAPDIAGQKLDNKSTSFQFKSQHSFKIQPGLSAELNFSYDSPVTFGVMEIGTRYGFDAGISKSLMNKKASLKLAANDIFNTQINNINSAFPGLYYTLYGVNDRQYVSLTFTYRFGKNEIKPARNRSTGLEAEQGRMKN
ncbi:outer membrane beta-barrel protein [Pedobacter sp. G11]|uniref:outer membrane beta-barrel protein n=1 Tax=Pedobacter sp. G11 TaxID=2482728 RepID=UPI00143D5AF9|nr:outer membrane beta-barrel protein [Pedobacter sp. G11]